MYSGRYQPWSPRRIGEGLTGNTLGTARSTGLDLTAITSATRLGMNSVIHVPGLEGDGEVGNVGRLGLTGTVRGHDTPTAGLGELDAVISLSEGTAIATRRSLTPG